MSSGPARRPSPGRQKAVGASKRPVAAGSEIKVVLCFDVACKLYPVPIELNHFRGKPLFPNGSGVNCPPCALYIWQVNVILDTKARREYPESLTHAEVKVQAGKTIAWFLDEVKKEFGTAVPIQGVRCVLWPES